MRRDGRERMGEESGAGKKEGGCCFKISTDECIHPTSLGRKPIGSTCLSLHSFMPRSEGEVKGAKLLVCVLWASGASCGNEGNLKISVVLFSSPD